MIRLAGIAVAVAMAGGCRWILGIDEIDVVSVDAPTEPDDATVDATVIDADTTVYRIEAEVHTSSITIGGHSWNVRTDIAGYSGASFMQALPVDANFCIEAQTLATCAASLEFAIDFATSQTYYFHVRMLAMDQSHDSLWFGIDGTPEPMIDVIEDGAWRWMTGALVPVTAGSHTVHVWMREPGARVDVIAMSPDAIPPP